MDFENIFSQSMTCLFIFLIHFDEEKFLIVIRCYFHVNYCQWTIVPLNFLQVFGSMFSFHLLIAEEKIKINTVYELEASQRGEITFSTSERENLIQNGLWDCWEG